MTCKCEDADYLRKLIREEIEKMRNEPKKPENKLNLLVALYLDNFAADRVKPSGATVAGQIKVIAKQLSYEEVKALVPILASAGKPISAAWVNWAKDQMQIKEKKTAPTPQPPIYDPTEFNNPHATVMPEDFRDAIRKFSKGIDD